ncbi:hypothetical protein [Nodosilinea nodulosa]|nr:hypothetical protein [Nodosilinea nodulosa]
MQAILRPHLTPHLEEWGNSAAWDAAIAVILAAQSGFLNLSGAE